MRKILLVEPGYKCKYPPMALMKISTYHKRLGDEVRFVKGCCSEVDEESWDRIYITSLFTFDFKITVETIRHYIAVALDPSRVYVGGIMASLMPRQVCEATGLPMSQILVGLFTDTSVVGDRNDCNVDTMPLDYDILEEVEYRYPAGDNYFAYTTRGCPNKCSFCAVPKLEPEFTVTNNIAEQIRIIDEKFGPKRNLLLLDNNVLNAPNLREIIDGLCEAGFEKGARFIDPGEYDLVIRRYMKGDRGEFLDKKLKKYLSSFKRRIKSTETLEQFLEILLDSEESDDYAAFMLDHVDQLDPIINRYRNKTTKLRFVDFNQGVDARKINDETMKELARIEIRPLRIAFDNVAIKSIYIEAVKTAHRYGVDKISNYMLFNYKDRPSDLYERLRINIELNRELGISIFSFPMKYSPVDQTDRKYVGKYWTKKQLRAISAILQVTKGVVAAGSDFFFKAFGKNIDEYHEILAMPREFIMFRSLFENAGLTGKWRILYQALSDDEKDSLLHLTSLTRSELLDASVPERFREIIEYYLIRHDEIESSPLVVGDIGS